MNEGFDFVSSTTVSTLDSYVRNLFPALDDPHVKAIVDTYASADGLETPFDQAVALQGECKKIVVGVL